MQYILGYVGEFVKDYVFEIIEFLTVGLFSTFMYNIADVNVLGSDSEFSTTIHVVIELVESLTKLFAVSLFPYWGFKKVQASAAKRRKRKEGKDTKDY